MLDARRLSGAALADALRDSRARTWALVNDLSDAQWQMPEQEGVNPVRWEDSIRWLLANGVTEFTEVGPGKVLAGLLKRIDRKAKCENVNEALS